MEENKMSQMFTEKVFDNYKTYEYELAGRKLVVESGKMDHKSSFSITPRRLPPK